jgi:hypothetical protein
VRQPGLVAALPEPPHGGPLRVAECGLDRRGATPGDAGFPAVSCLAGSCGSGGNGEPNSSRVAVRINMG